MTNTLLDITQSILSDMSGDSVDSIFDTEESEQVARVVVNTYNSLVSNKDWQSHRKLAVLTGPADNSTPTHMTLPSNTKRVESISYDCIKSGETKKAYREVKYMFPDDFLRFVSRRDNTSSAVDTISDPSGVELFIYNNASPTYYTSFDDDTVIFDSYDSDVESTLQGSKTQSILYVQPTLALQDSAVPDLPVDALSLLVEEATSRAQAKIAEFRDVNSEAEAKRQRRTLARSDWKVNAKRRYPNYGRKV